MQIEIFIFMILALSAVSAALLALLVARSGKDKDIEAYLLRLSQEMQDRQSAALDSFRSSIEQRMQALEKSISDISSSQRNQMALFFKENRDLNDKLDKRQKEGTDSISAILSEIRRENTRTMETVLKETAGLTEEVRKGMDRIRTENTAQLDKMRLTVDEKLQSTLENRISKSFEQVTKNLEALYRSIGEMDKLAGDISSLNKMFSNVKVRGTWGEVQAENILSDRHFHSSLLPVSCSSEVSPQRRLSLIQGSAGVPGAIRLGTPTPALQEDYQNFCTPLRVA